MIFYQKKKLYIESYENILTYDISYKTSMGAKSLRIRYDKTHGLTKYLVLFDHGWFDKICDKIKYLIGKKVLLQVAFNHKIDSNNCLPIENILTFHNVIILIA